MSFLDLLRLRYPVQSYALFYEVQSATAYKGKQRADAVAMGLWPSRGLDMIGFEFKCSRSDWLRELKQPDKAEEIFQFCDRWYLVVSGGGIVHDGELPPTWGLLVQEGNVLKERKEAPKLEAKPIEREFLASLLRSAQKDRDKALAQPREEIYRQVMDETVKTHQEKLDHAAKAGREKYEALLANVRAFELATGVELDVRWGKRDHAPIGNAIHMLNEKRGLADMLDGARGNVEHILKQIELASKELAGWPGFPKGDEAALGRDRNEERRTETKT